MVAALIAHRPGFEASDLEAALPRPSYTLHTLRALKAKTEGAQEWYLIVGADNLALFREWHQPDAVLREARLAVYPRAGIALDTMPPGTVRLDCPEIPEESRALREGLRRTPRETLARLPAPVSAYIRKHGLYGVPGEAAP
jgi:nicotinate-nucleotide adenylyltransferase